MSMTNRLMAIAVTMKAYNSVLGVVVVSVLGLSAASAAQAALAPNATVTSDAVQGMRYTGGAGPNRITVITAPGDRFIVGDTAPITPGPGCTPATVGGGLFGVSCLAPRTANGQFRPFTVNAGGGDDVVNNSSTAAMRANGGPGNDTLNGGFLNDGLSDFNGRDILRGNAGNDALSTDFGPDDGLKDVLDGGSGDDDLRAGPGPDELRGGDGNDTLRGGLGADLLDAGPGSKDAVVYLENAHENVRVIVSLDNSANDGIPANGGIQGEKDNVLNSAESVFGGTGPDLLTGNDGPNSLSGNAGDDFLAGHKGADILDGGLGNDQLASNKFFGVPVEDGAFDILIGGPGDSDRCRIPFPIVEFDATTGCELIDQD